MGVDEALELIGTLVVAQTGRPLDNLQRSIVRNLWLNPRVKYLKIAEDNGYSEAHVKDVAYQLWQTLSKALGEKASKITFQPLIEQYGRSQSSSTPINTSSAKIGGSKEIAAGLDFVGREGAIADLDELVRLNKKLILILGGAGLGKTTLARKYLYQKFDCVIEFVLAKERKDVATVEGLVEEKLKQLGEEPAREFSVSLERLRQKLETERIGVLIDNLEPALEGNGCFVPERRPYVELLRMLSTDTIQAVTLITSRDRLYEPAVKVETYTLKGLDPDAWQQFFESDQLNPQMVMHLSTLTDMHRHYGGNAKAMDLLRSAVQQDAAGNLERYWEMSKEDLLRNPSLENLVVEQFKRLQEIAPQAYTLLCRLGCYRYQDVPTIPLQGLLCLLWDVSERRMRIIDALKSRSLVEVRDEVYWLHPMIREEAISRLRENVEEWRTANLKAAEFWAEHITVIQTTEDAKQALETYYHYVEIGETEKAGSLFIEERGKTSRSDELLGVSLYTLGLLELSIHLIKNVINTIESDYTLCILHGMLGNCYWMTGQLNEAVDEYKIARRIVAECLIEREGSREKLSLWIKPKRIEVASLLHLGLCKIGLWELEEAIGYFEEVMTEAIENAFDFYLRDAQFCLAFINSFLGDLEKAKYFIGQAIYLIDNSATWKQDSPNKWSIGYCFLFLAAAYKNLREPKTSFDLLERAISFANESHYPQVKAKALTGIAELYREQQDFEKALTHHFGSIELLEKINAKCDLAEAYFQLGLTYQIIGEVAQSKESIERAIKLYEDMNAPKQIERVRQAIENTKA